MTVAINPETGAAVYYDDAAATWVPAQVATNDAGDSLAFDGKQWSPVSLPKKAAPIPAAPETPSDVWDNPTPGGLLHIIKSAYQGFRAPGDALSGAFDATTEQDLASGTNPRQRMVGAAMDMAGVAVPGTLARTPGARTLPTQPVNLQSPLLEAAGNIGVPIPKVLATDSVPVQRVGAAVSQVPMAGEPLVQAVRQTTEGLGNAASRVQGDLGIGSPSAAGGVARDRLESWITDGSKKVSNRLYGAVDSSVNPAVKTELRATVAAADAIAAERANSNITGRSAAVDIIMEGATAPGGMNYQGIKGLRSYLGEMSPQELVASGLRETEVKRLYGALTNDLRTSIQNAGGPTALAKFERANSAHSQIIERRNDLYKIIGVKGDAAPEAVFGRLLAMAGSKTTADIARLSLARKAMGADAWREVGSAVVARMGRDAQGTFSPERFLGPNGYNGLSPRAKDILFSREHRLALDNIAVVSAAIKDKISAFENRSRTGGTVIGTAGLTGMMTDPLTTLASGLGAHVLANILASPAGAKAVANVVRAQNTVLASRPSPQHQLAMQNAVRELVEIAKRLGQEPRPQEALANPAALSRPE